MFYNDDYVTHIHCNGSWKHLVMLFHRLTDFYQMKKEPNEKDCESER